MSDKPSEPFVSVIIPVKEPTRFLLTENLPAMQKQTFKRFEVIVLPDNAEKTPLLQKKYAWLRIIPTGKITRPAEKRDIGVKKAKGEIIAFIDDDAYPSPDWLKKAVDLFKKKDDDVVAVCGPGILPDHTNFWEKVFNEILKTWIGSGTFTYRFIQQKTRFVDDYPSMNFLVYKKEFLAVGGFDSEYWPGEDSKLCEDLVYKNHKKILYSPAVITFHHRRKSLSGFLLQHANYGFHRGAFFSHGDKNSRRLSYLVPTVFVLYLLLVLCVFSFHILNTKYLIFYAPLLVYLLLGFTLIIQTFRNTKNLLVTFLTFPVLFFMHLIYGILFVKGFITGLLKKEKIY